MAHEKAALDARGIQVVALSVDTPAESREMAEEYGIEFPLLEDKEMKFAEQYAGISTEGFPFPAIFVLRQDGSVHFRQISETKDSRVYVRELLTIVDKMSGTTGMPDALGYSFDSQLRLGLGGGLHHAEGDNSFAGDVWVEGLHTLGSHFSLGVHLGSLVTPGREVHAAALLRLRKSYWEGIGELYLQVPIGLARRFSDDSFSKNGLLTGLSVGTEQEISPTFFFFSDLHYGVSLYSHESDDERFVSTRVEWQLGAGLKF